VDEVELKMSHIYEREGRMKGEREEREERL
jgi:hypothetical protein